jgi:cbb3-type cytochrome oxidase subunit 3
MENNDIKKMPWNTKIGFITAPLMIIAGIYFIYNNVNKGMGSLFILLGIFRLGTTIFLYRKHNKNNEIK